MRFYRLRQGTMSRGFPVEREASAKLGSFAPVPEKNENRKFSSQEALTKYRLVVV